MSASRNPSRASAHVSAPVKHSDFYWGGAVRRLCREVRRVDDTQETVWGGLQPRRQLRKAHAFSHDAASALLKVSGNWRRSEAAFSRNMTKWSRANHKPTGREHRLWFWVIAGLGIISTTERSWLTLCFISKTIEPLMLSQGCDSDQRF